jgi:hypothetical protein
MAQWLNYGKLRGKEMLNNIKIPIMIGNIRTKMEGDEGGGRCQVSLLLAGRMKNIFYLFDKYPILL